MQLLVLDNICSEPMCSHICKFTFSDRIIYTLVRERRFFS